MAEVKFTREDTKVIKGLAIVLMLYHHLFRFPDRISEAIDYQPLFFVEETSSAYLMGGFGKLCVALFLFLSGYGLYSSCRNKEHITTVLKDKVVNLYTRYWLVFAVFISICALCGVDKKITAYSFLRILAG